MKKYFFFVFMALAITMAACQSIPAIDSTELDQLRAQKQSLTDMLIDAQTQISDLQDQVAALSTQVAQQSPQPVEQNVEGLASEILPFLQAKDYAPLATFVHPQLGLRFSPQLFIHTDTDLVVFTRGQVANFEDDANIYTWGTHAARGDLLQLGIDAFWDEYVVPLGPDQEWVMLAEGESNPSIAIDNFNESYPRADYVDFLKPGTEEFGYLDWQLLRLVFEKAADGAFYLVGIIHDNWVP